MYFKVHLFYFLTVISLIIQVMHKHFSVLCTLYLVKQSKNVVVWYLDFHLHMRSPLNIVNAVPVRTRYNHLWSVDQSHVAGLVELSGYPVPTTKWGPQHNSNNSPTIYNHFRLLFCKIFCSSHYMKCT